MSTIGRVRKYIEALAQGEPFTSRACLALGSRAAIDQALARLVRAGTIARVTRGVFVKPKSNRFVGNIMPEPIRIAEAIAKTAGATIQLHGAEAARRLELTTQVPMQPVFYTSGASKTFRIGKLQVRLQHASPRKLVLAGRPAGLALIALWDLGKRAVTPAVIESIRKKLPPAEFEALKAAAGAMPAWMAQALLERDHACHG